MVLLVSTTTSAGEGRERGFIADRIEMRTEMKKKTEANDTSQIKLHCRSENYKVKTAGC